MFDYLSQFERKKIFRIVGRRFSEGLLIALSPIASAATITVTSLDASSTATNGQVSLAEAIQAANGDVSVDGSAAGSGSDTIVFHSSLAGQTIRWSASAALSITSNITIDGDINGDGVPDIILSGDVNNNGTRDANESSGLQSDSGGVLTVRHLDFRHFVGTSATGAIRANSGSITIEDSIFRNNSGAAINSSTLVGATVVVRNTLLHDNDASIVGSTGMSSVLRLGGSNNHIVENVVLVNNTGNYSAAGTASSGGIIIVGNATGSVKVTNSTIANNAFINSGAGAISAGGIGWALSGNSGAFTFQNNIVIGNTVNGGSANFSAATGYTSTTNLIDTSVNFVNTATRDYRLASTAANAINQGTLAGSPSTDIRGFNRPRGGGVDIGAYEVLYSAAPVVDLDTGTGGNNSSVNFSGSAVALMPNIDISQSDGDTQVSGATLSLSGVLDVGDETLSLTGGQITTAAGYGIAVSGSGTTSITLSGVSTLANYESILALVQYNNIDGAYSSGTRSVTVEINDDVGSTSRTASVVVASADVAPVFQNSTPSLSNINTTGATLTVRLDEAGTAFFVVVADGAAAPSSAQVTAGQNNSGAAALVSGSVTVASSGVDYTGAISGLTAGTAYDVYVVARDAALNVQATPTLVNLTTSTANALYFDDNAKITGLTGISPAAFTVEFRLFLDTETPEGNWQGIYWTDNNNTGIFIEDNYAVSLWTTQSTAYKSDLLLTHGAWNHVAISYSAGNGVRIYVNGVLSGLAETGSPGAGVLPLTDVTMGYGPGLFGLPAGGYALGDSALEDFRIWNVERTLQQINDDRDAELAPPYSANLVRYYDFNHGIGGANNAGITTLVERTGNGANGTLADFALSGSVSNWVETSSLVDANTPPILSNLSGDSVAWSGVGNTVALDAGGNAAVGDAENDLANWSGSSLTVQRNGTAVTADNFGFNTSGALFTISGGNLQSGGSTFATFTNTNGILTISFTSSGTPATTALVNDVTQRITYRNDTPYGDATVRFALSDGIAVTTADVTVTSNTIYVDVANDTDVEGDAADGFSLREAIARANAQSGSQTIVLGAALAEQTITLGSMLSINEAVIIDADAASGFTLVGSSLALNGALTVHNGEDDTLTIGSGALVTGSGALTKTGAGTFSVYAQNSTHNGTLTVSGGVFQTPDEAYGIPKGNAAITLDGGTLSFNSSATITNDLVLAAGGGTITGGAPLVISGVISGNGGLIKAGGATLSLSGVNTYTGSTTVSAGTLSVASDNNLGSGALNLSGGGLSITGATTIDNSISLTGSASVANSNAATLSGVISGTGNLAKSGAGTLTLSATSTYTGTTSVGAGTLSIASDNNIGNGSLNLSAGTTLSVTGAITLDNAIALSGDAVVNNSNVLTLSGVISGGFGITKTGAATLTLSGTNTYTGTTTISAGALNVAGDSNLGAGPLTLAAGTTLAITGAGTIDNSIGLAGNAGINNSADVTLAGVLSGGFGLQKSGAGILTLSGTNTQTGTLNVSAGLLHVIGSTSSATSVASGATLGGSGTLGGSVNIQNGGTLSPGSSPGTLTINGDLTMAAGSTLAVEIDGATAGTGYDQLVVAGPVDVTGATLSVTHNYVPGIGDSYTIIVNDAVDAITGSFSGLAEGGTFAASGNATELTASFVGGDGNDFTLTAPTNQPPVIGGFDGDGRTFIQGAGPILLDDSTDAATVTDADSADFNNGTLVVSIVANGVSSEDVLAINSQGTGAGEIGVSGTDVTYEGITIGSFTGGTGGDNLEITFNGNAHAAAAQALVRNLTYSNANGTNTISQLARTVRVTLSDGDGGTSSNADVTVAVVETVAPSVVSIVVADTALAVGETTTVTITFSEAVTNLQIADFTVANGALSNLTSADGGITWTATLTPSATTQDTDNLITLNNTVYTDLAGNPGTGTTDSNNYAIDTLRPTATIVVADMALAAGETSQVTITFSEAVTGFTTADLTVVNGTLSSVSSSDGGITWTATLTPTAGVEDPSNLIMLDNTGVTDAAGNAGSGSTNSNNYAIDTVRPTATLVVTDTSLIDGQTTTLTITFSEAISGLTTDDLVADNAVLSFLTSGDGGVTWTATLTPDAAVDEATNAVTLTNTGVTDAAGNTGLGTTSSNNYAIDSAAPGVVSVSVPADTTYVAGQALSFTVNTSENVTVDTTGGTPQLALTIGATSRNAAFASGSGTSALVFSYTVQAGDVDDDGIAVGALSANSGTLKDAAGNDMTLTLNAVADTSGVLVDAVLPALVSLNPADDAIGVAPGASLVITLDEDIELGAGTIAVYDSDDVLFASIDVTNEDGQLSIDGAALTIDLTANLIEDVSYYVLIDGGAITDLAGNAFAGIADPTSWSFAVADISPPTVTAITVAGSPAANAAAIQFTVTFDEVPANISVSDFTLTPSSGAVSGNIASHSPVNANTVTVTIDQITGTGTLRLDVNANSGITDTLGNGDGTNGYVAAFTSGDLHTVDREAPATPVTPTLASGSDTGDSNSDGITNAATPTLTGTAEPNAVITLTSSVDGVLGTATTDGSGNWSFTPSTMLTEATHFITVTATDGAGNVSSSSANLTLQLDTSAPTGHSVAFAASLLNAGNSTAAGFTIATGEIGATYNYTITSAGGGTPVTGTGTISSVPQVVTGLNLGGLGDGVLTLSLVLTDTAGNAATAVTAGATLDTALPSGHSVSFGATDFNSANASAVSFSFADAEVGASYSYTITSSGGGTPVTGNGTVSSANQTISGVDLSGLADGTLTLSVVVSDASGNAAPAVTANANLDQTLPSVILSSASGATVNSAFTTTIAFSEPVNNFVVGDITAANATLSGFADNGGGNFSVIVTPTADGTVTLNVAAGVAQDAAGNNNTAATQLSRTYDGTAPTLASSSPADGASNVAGDANLVLTFSEPVVAGSGNLTLFDAADDSVVEAFAVGSATINSNVLTLDPASNLIPTHSYYLQIASTALVDSAGNAYAGIADATTLNFTVINMAPVANADVASVAEDASVDTVVLANDTDSDSRLNAASVTVVTAPQNGTTSVNTATGVITYTPAANFNGSDSFSYTVEDVHSSVSNVAVVSVTVTPVNDAPVAVGDLATTAEDNPISIDVAANDTDIDVGDSVDGDTIVIVSAPAQGSATVVNGEVLYTPSLDYTGSDSFTYTIEDSAGATSNVATVIVNVTGVNDLPVAAADTATVDEDSSVDIDVLANDSDVDGTLDAATVQVLTNPVHGTAEVDALTGEIAYTPAANFHGSDSFTYVVQDNDGGTSNPATVTITVTSVNDAPVVNADVAVLQEDTALSINVLGNDADIDGTLVPASVQVVTAAQFGSTSVDPATGAIVYTPDEEFNGGDSFTYRVQDNEGAWSAPVPVTITVEGVNDEPLANNDTAVTPEDTAVTIDLLANDNDVDGSLDPGSLVLTQPANGTVTDNGDGTVSYSPAANFFGVDSFTYTVADNDGGISNTATVTVTVNPVNDAPLISGTPAVSVNQDSAYSFIPTASDVDPNTTLNFSIANQPEWASFNTATGALTGTPGNDDVGDYDGIVISVSDGLLSTSLPAFAIMVVDVNDAPQVGGGAPPARINQDGSYSFVPDVVDVDGDALTFTVTNLPQWASFNPATGAITGTPGNNDVGTYNDIVISVSDGTTTTVLDSFSITVVNVNDPPVIVADSYELAEGGLLQPNASAGVLANDFDIDGDNLVAILVSGPRNASEFSLSEDGSFRYLHNGSETRVDSFTYRISDSTINSAPVTVNLAIAPVNDAPVFITQPVLAVAEGTAYRYDVGVTDPDSVVTLSLGENAPDWLTLNGFRLSGAAPVNMAEPVPVVLRAFDGEYTVDQTFNLAVLSQQASLVNISTSWRGLPSIVDNTVDLQITLTHAAGPALPNANLRVSLQGLDVASSMASCNAVTGGFICATTFNTGASRSFRLRVTPQQAGSLVVNLAVEAADGSVIARGITDVSATPRAVSQGNVTFSLANATALASINLLNDGTRELVAGTSLGDTVKLLDYSLSSGTARIIGEIQNRGYTDRVRVADIDRDGLDDIVVVNRSGDLGAVYYDRGGEFQQETSNQRLAHAREALLSDLNGDEYPELILGANGFNLYIYENNEGVYDQAPLVFTSPASIMHFALLRRLPTDASLEGTLVISSAEAVQLVRFGLNPDGGVGKSEGEEGTGSAVSQKFELLQSIAIPGVSSVQLLDVDGDGREEIVVSTTHQDNSAEASGVTVIEVNQNDQLQIVARLGAASAERVEVADFNNDGRPDLLVSNSNNSYQFYRGTGSATSWTLTNTILYHRSTLMIPEDVNGDGLADVLIYEEGEGQVELYLSAPDGDTGETADLTLSASTRAVRNDRYHFEYAVEVRNEGEFVAQHPRVVVPLPQGIDVVSLPSYCNEDAEVDEVTCNLQDLEPGAGQMIPLILAGDRRTDGITLTAHATSDALEIDTADNTASATLDGLFQYRHARIKGGGGSLNYTWFAVLFGLAFARRRRTERGDRAENKKMKISGRKVAAVVLPLCFATAIQPGEVAAQSPENSYIEGHLGLISSDWDMMTFYYDLAGSTQAAALAEKDDQRFGWQLLYGYRVHPQVAIEVGYLNSGETSLEVDAIVSDAEALRQVLRDHAPISGEGPYAGLRFSMFSRQQQEVYAKVGLWSWSAGYTLTVGDQAEWVTRSDQDWLVGLGFSLPVMEKLKLGGNIQTTALGDDRIVFIGLGLSYHFDVKRQ